MFEAMIRYHGHRYIFRGDSCESLIQAIQACKKIPPPTAIELMKQIRIRCSNEWEV